MKCTEASEVDEFEFNQDLGRDADDLPPAVAAGANFGLEYAGTIRDDGDRVLVTIEPAYRGDEAAPDVFLLSQPVEVAFLATDTEGQVVDFISVTALEALELAVYNAGDTTEGLSLDVGETTRLTVAPRHSRDAARRSLTL